MAKAVIAATRHPSLDLEPWRDVVARLYRERSEFAGGPDDALLAGAEETANATTEHASRIWMVSLFALILALLRGRRADALSVRELGRIMAATQDPPGVSSAVRLAARAHMLGERRAQQEMRGPGGANRPPASGPPRSRDSLFAEWLARQSAGSKMREWAEGMRQDVRWQTVQAIRAGAPAQVLRERLESRWANYGQRFALIAQTELAIAYNGGYLLSLPEHSYVRIPPIGDARVCPTCRHLLEGKVFEVLHRAPEHPTRLDWETKLWPGKSGKRNDTGVVVPAVPQHPGCRHRVVWYSGNRS